MQLASRRGLVDCGHARRGTIFLCLDLFEMQAIGAVTCVTRYNFLLDLCQLLADFFQLPPARISANFPSVALIFARFYEFITAFNP